MIDSLKIKNIQSHKDSELKFSDGVNAIVGTSNNGKSAILRALIWVITNRPLGVDILCSDWALDKKGNQISPMEVEVEKNGHVLIRCKSKSKNQYLLDDEELNAIGTDVPPEVKKFFSLSDTNIQKQQDKPFLVSESSSDVAKYFNSMMDLNVIDNILKKTEVKKREIRSSVSSQPRTVDAVKTIQAVGGKAQPDALPPQSAVRPARPPLGQNEETSLFPGRLHYPWSAYHRTGYVHTGIPNPG